MKIFSFPEIANKESKILILGTMPGAKSLLMNQYYAHNGNQFWKILFHLFSAPFSFDYEFRSNFLLKNRIAVWDVLKACVRDGSSDSAIVREEPNDFNFLLKKYPSIKLIAFNGKNPSDYFQMYFRDSLNIPSIILPSTSPANTTKSFDNKAKEWSQILNYLN